MRTLLTFAAVLFVSVTLAQEMTSGGRLKPEQAIMDIRHYTVSLNVDPVQKSIDGFAEIDLITSQPTKILLFDFTTVLTLRNIWVNKKEQPYTHKDNLVSITLPADLPAGKVKVKIQYDGKPHVAVKPPGMAGSHGQPIQREIHGLISRARPMAQKFTFHAKIIPAMSPMKVQM